MSDEIKKALEDYKRARRETDSLPLFGDYDHCPRNVYLDDETLEKALEKEREAAITYHTLLFKGRGWTQSQIDDQLKKLGLV
jgi:hypothetical protein